MRTSGLISAVGTAVVLTVAPTAAQSLVSPREGICARHLATAAVRLARLWARATIECRLDVAWGHSSGPCPGPDAEAAIAPIVERLFRRAELFCEGRCSVSPAVHCVAERLCPPLPSIGAYESCTAGVDQEPFDMAHLGFPGPFCEQAIGRPIEASSDIADCVRTLSLATSDALADAAFPGAAPGELSDHALVCQRVIARRTRRLASVVHATLTGCRNAILRGARSYSADDCPRLDPVYLERTAIHEQRLATTVRATCSDDEVVELDICGMGAGGITTVEEAITCATAAAYGIAASTDVPILRDLSFTTLLESAYPPEPRCGDGKRDQIADAFLPLGEECDGDDDDACPGDCILPGDLFECTCGDRPRLRFLAESAATSLDHGWTGTAMDVPLPEGSGFTMDLAACDCDDMDGATCIGATTDPVCAVSGTHRPRCQWDSPGAPRCDARGNGNFVDEDTDCWVCDEHSANAGARCSDEGDCDPLCYDADRAATRPCPAGQADCATGEVCRGQCDRTQACLVLGTAPPVPVSRRGAPICVVQHFRDDLIGTTDVTTGEHAIFQRTRVRIYLGETANVPCPLCGGACEGGPFDGDPCRGSCSTSGMPCRFDSDCAGSDVCTARSAECPQGACDLALFCHGGANDGAPCRIESDTGAFGTVSSDCPPALAKNITGNGLVVDYLPATSEQQSLPSTVPCTAPGYELFECPCPADGGARTKPNECAPACNAGAEIGLGCADGDGSTGQFTTCDGGVQDGQACDESSDCPGGDCTENPLHCSGDPAFERFACTTNADCGLGACVDACPSGRCGPLCLPRIEDAEKGACAAGPPLYHCSGTLESFRDCGKDQAEGSCAAVCDLSLTPCTGPEDCPLSETCTGPCEQARECAAGDDGVLGNVDDIVGGGICVEDVRTCPLDPIEAEGGDVFNGRGDPARPFSVATFCLGRTNNPGVNTIVGVGGPGRLRRAGTYVTNGFATLP
jgi:hypothetical protein